MNRRIEITSLEIMKLLIGATVVIRNYRFIILPMFLVFACGFLFYYFPVPFFPDFLNIKNYSKVYELFNLIISSLVSLIGIYISVSLVAYEFFKQKSGIDFQKSLLINHVNAYYISFSVSTIIFTFLSSLFISDVNPNYKEVSVIYYNAILFISVIALLFPVAFNLFSSLKPEKIANEELENINSKSIFIKEADYNDIDKQATLIENDHIVKISNIIIALISVSENIKAQTIIQKVTVKLSHIIIDIEKPSDKEYVIERLISFYIKIIDFSLLQPNNTSILKSIWFSIERMYSIVIEKEETTFHFEKFRKKFFERYFSRLIENNKEELIIDGIVTIRNIIQEQVFFNMPEDNQIYDFNHYREFIEKDFKYPKKYTKEDSYNSQKWREIAIEFLDCFSFLVNKAILHNKPDLINKCFEQINELNFKFYLKGIGVYKQCFFYIKSANIICDNAYTAFERNVFIQSQDANHLTPNLFENLIEDKHPAARPLLKKYCQLLINLQQINKLDRWFLGGLTIGEFIITEGDLGSIAKKCAMKYNDGKEIQNCLEDCISTFKILKEGFENKLPENYGLYSVIKWQFNNILESLEEEKIDNIEIINELKRLIASFKEKDSTNPQP